MDSLQNKEMDTQTDEQNNIQLSNSQIDVTQNKENKSILNLLPAAFTQFLKENDINLEYFSEIENFPRYIRLKPDANISINELKNDLGTEKVEQIEYLNNFYSIPADIKIVNSKYYSSGVLYGIDLSSAAVIKALDPQKGDKVLDLCCCPGMKLCNIADIVGPEGKAIGVDINETRLNTCRSIVKKYKLDHIIKLELCDGTTYDKENLFDRVLVDAECTHDGSLKHLAKFVNNQKAVLQDLVQSNKSNELNQTKQVDKEENKNENNSEVELNENYQTCKEQTEINPKKNNDDTCDTLSAVNDQSLNNSSNNQIQDKNKKDSNKQNSQKKISNNELKRRRKQMEKNNSNIYTQKKVKKNEWSLDDFEERVLDPIKLNNIVDLQKKLLTNGFKLCKDGGIIVYSTCSFARNQNEDVVQWFLQEYPDQVELIHPFNNQIQNMPACKPGFIENTVRFDPFVSKSGGMFVSKFIKNKQQKQE